MGWLHSQSRSRTHQSFCLPKAVMTGAATTPAPSLLHEQQHQRPLNQSHTVLNLLYSWLHCLDAADPVAGAQVHTGAARMNKMNERTCTRKAKHLLPKYLWDDSLLPPNQVRESRANTTTPTPRRPLPTAPATSTGGRCSSPGLRSHVGKGWGSQLSPETLPLAPSSHHISASASAEAPPRLGVPPSAERLLSGATRATASTGKAKGATEYAWA